MAASVAANTAAAHPSMGARIVAAWPAVALLLVVEMLSRARPTPDPLATTECNGRASDNLAHVAGDGTNAESIADSTPPHREAGQVRDDEVQSSRTIVPTPRPKDRAGQKASAVQRVRAERPNASLADIAKAVGVSERHVRRLLRSQSANDRMGPPASGGNSGAKHFGSHNPDTP